MILPQGNCPDCGGDQPLEQVHAVAGECPEARRLPSLGEECPEWACPSCGAAFIMAAAATAAAAGFRRPVRAA
jgi:hypothetical protein